MGQSETRKRPAKTRSRAVSPRYRLAVASRVLAALIGGYLLSALMSICLAMCLPLLLHVPRAEGVVLGMTLSFVFYLSAVIWCFACRSAWRAWAGVLLPSVVLAALYAGVRWLA